MTKFYILNQKFETVYMVDRYESILWVDRYYEPGDFELVVPPVSEIFEYGIPDNYLWSSDSEHLMIIEKLELTTSYTDGIRLKLTGRSLESILERRVLLYRTYFKSYLEDAIRQIIDWAIIKPSDTDRKISNFIFEYSGDSRISSITTDYQFEKGVSILSATQDMIKNAKIGFKVTLNNSNQFVMRLIIGDNRSYDQDTLPWVIFSPKFNNLITDKFTEDHGTNYHNTVYVEGEAKEEEKDDDGNVISEAQKAPMIVTGNFTGLARREHYESATDIQHKWEDEMTGEEIELTDEEYMQALIKRSQDKAEEYGAHTVVESEVEPKVGNMYGTDYFMGDIVQVENGLGLTAKIRVTEFITQYDAQGVKQYPTFTSEEES